MVLEGELFAGTFRHFIINLVNINIFLHSLDDWNYDKGYINEEMFSKHLPPPNNETLIMFCGPKGMNGTARNILEKMNYSNDSLFKY